MQTGLYQLLTTHNMSDNCAIEVANAFTALIVLHHAKLDLESKGYLVRSDGNGDFDLHDMNTHQVVKWHYDFDTSVFTIIKPTEVRDFTNAIATYLDDIDLTIIYCKPCTIKAGHAIEHSEPYCLPPLKPLNL